MTEAAVNYSVQQWNRAEVELRSERDYRHPDTDVSISAVFTAPSGTTITLPGFWDGDDSWKLRFAPTELGRWTYLVSSTDTSNPGLHGVSGAIEATEYTGDLDIYRRGFVRASDNRRAFEYADGTAFFWLANTHWQAPNYERLDVCNNPYELCTSQFRCSVDHDRARGFTVYQTYPDAALNDGGGNVSQVDWWTENYTHLNPQAFREQFDVMMDYLADSGTVIALGMGVHTESGRIGATALSHFARYVTARYAAHPVVWITGQEVDIENEHGKLSTWKAVAETIAENDGYHHPLGAHMWSPGEPTTFGQEPWHDWFPTQGGHEGIRTQAHYQTYWDYSPTKPFLETEANYEEIWTVALSDTRRSAWKALQCGSYGYTYGVAGVWAIKWDYDVPGWDSFQNGIPWFDGLDRPGGTQMTILKNFYQDLGDWQDLVPAFGDPRYGTFADTEQSVLATDGNATYVVYFYDTALTTGTLSAMDDKRTYSAWWFDPRTGTSLVIDESITSSSGSWAIPNKPDADDWVLLATYRALRARTAPPPVRTADLAFNKEAVAVSTLGDHFASKALDGHPATFWSADDATFPQVLQVNLGARFALHSITQQFHHDDGTELFYRLEGSDDAVSWATLVDRTSEGASTAITTDLVTGSCQFVRVVVTGISNGQAASIARFEVQGADLAAASPPGLGHVDLGAVSAIRLVSHELSDAESYRIDGSSDGAVWVRLLDRTVDAGARTHLDSVTGSYRYLRVVSAGVSSALRAFGAVSHIAEAESTH